MRFKTYVRITEGGPILIFGLRFTQNSYLELHREDYFILYNIFRSAQKFHNGTTESMPTEFLFWNYVERTDLFLYCVLRSDRNSILEPQMADHSLYCILRSALGLLYKSYCRNDRWFHFEQRSWNTSRGCIISVKRLGEWGLGATKPIFFPLKKGENGKI